MSSSAFAVKAIAVLALVSGAAATNVLSSTIKESSRAFLASVKNSGHSATTDRRALAETMTTCQAYRKMADCGDDQACGEPAQSHIDAMIEAQTTAAIAAISNVTLTCMLLDETKCKADTKTCMYDAKDGCGVSLDVMYNAITDPAFKIYMQALSKCELLNDKTKCATNAECEYQVQGENEACTLTEDASVKNVMKACPKEFNDFSSAGIRQYFLAVIGALAVALVA